MSKKTSKKRSKKKRNKAKKNPDQTSLNLKVQLTSADHQQKPRSPKTNLIAQKLILCILSLLFVLLNIAQIFSPAIPSTTSKNPPNLRQTTTAVSTAYYD